MTHYKFTVEEILSAAEQANYPNFNDSFITMEKGKVVQACVIGEAFLNLGMVPNGVNPTDLSYALENIKPNDGVARIKNPDYPGSYEPQFLEFETLSDFINELNSIKGYQGKKRLPKLARKYFSESLDKTVTITDEHSQGYGDSGIEYYD